MTGEEVIELSVEETNKLRAELGLAPLRIETHNAVKEEESADADRDVRTAEDAEVLELSVDETNKLREQLGLRPLRMGSGSGSTAYNSIIQDANLQEKRRLEEQALAEEKAKLEDDVRRGIAATFTEKSLGSDATNDVNSWAEKLRKGGAAAAAKKKKKKKKADKKAQQTASSDDKYDEEDLKGMNVSHALSELEAGSTTVMTLADAPILQTKEFNPHIVTGINEDANTPQLENVNLAEQSKQADGLRKKRQLEMGMGRAGGYAGFDDDEFLELGGSGAPSRAARGTEVGPPDGTTAKRPQKGFQIGHASGGENPTVSRGSDLFAMEGGRAISLEPAQADVQASDFMTEQEDLELRGKDRHKKSKRKDKFEKKKRKKDKKERKKNRRRQAEEDDDSEDEAVRPAGGKSLLDELEETAEEATTNSRKRTRSDDDDEKETKKEEGAPVAIPSTAKVGGKEEGKRARYDEIMDKGNARTKQAFGAKKKKAEDDPMDEEPDDAFLNAALAKARRLKKLRGMATAKGAEAVVEAVQRMPDAAPSSSEASATNGGITFSIDVTREFTRALRARTEQQSRQQIKAAAKTDKPSANTISTTTKSVVKKDDQAPAKMKVETVNPEEDTGTAADVDMAELAKEIKQDDEDDRVDVSSNFLDGTTGTTVAVGRGLAGVLNLFRQTGDLTRKHAGKEEMRGRAKDERTYEDYEALDLKKVVKLDDRYATEKDREFASRQLKLEYRDKYGRLLTRKEAFRDLCYQFHGHGSAKNKEEKKLKQMEREAAEKRLASQQLIGSDRGPGTLGALKATQKATGKAFIVHKT